MPKLKPFQKSFLDNASTSPRNSPKSPTKQENTFPEDTIDQKIRLINLGLMTPEELSPNELGIYSAHQARLEVQYRKHEDSEPPSQDDRH